VLTTRDATSQILYSGSILLLKFFELKIVLVINLSKKIVEYSFYFNLKIIRFFCRTLYNNFGALKILRLNFPFFWVLNDKSLFQREITGKFILLCCWFILIYVSTFF
jgi:hypothetical protein